MYRILCISLKEFKVDIFSQYSLASLIDIGHCFNYNVTLIIMSCTNANFLENAGWENYQELNLQGCENWVLKNKTP
jgi:hypothetical protein